MDDVDTRDKYKPHYGMNNLNSRQKKKDGNMYNRKKMKIRSQFENEDECFLVLNAHFQVEV